MFPDVRGVGNGVSAEHRMNCGKEEGRMLVNFNRSDVAVYVYVPKEAGCESVKLIFLGYTNKGYRVWNSRVGKIIQARDVGFLEAGEPKTKVDRVVTSDVFSVPKINKENDVEEGASSESIQFL